MVITMVTPIKYANLLNLFCFTDQMYLQNIGKVSLVNHDEEGLFANLPNPLQATRYHSLAVAEADLPRDLRITATTDDGEIMALCHRQHRVFGVQFHPESIETVGGHEMLRNFLNQDPDRRAA